MSFISSYDKKDNSKIQPKTRYPTSMCPFRAENTAWINPLEWSNSDFFFGMQWQLYGRMVPLAVKREFVRERADSPSDYHGLCV